MLAGCHPLLRRCEPCGPRDCACLNYSFSVSKYSFSSPCISPVHGGCKIGCTCVTGRKSVKIGQKSVKIGRKSVKNRILDDGNRILDDGKSPESGLRNANFGTPALPGGKKWSETLREGPKRAPEAAWGPSGHRIWELWKGLWGCFLRSRAESLFF